MLCLYVSGECTECGEIQDRLEKLSLAHQVAPIGSVETGHDVPSGKARAPLLRDGEKFYQGKAAILSHLEELEKFKQTWDKFQSDACYCDDQGNTE